MADLIEEDEVELTTTNLTAVVTTGSSPEKKIVSYYKITNRKTVGVYVDIHRGDPASPASPGYIVQQWYLDPAPAAGRDGGSIVAETNEKWHLEPGRSFSVKTSVANGVFVATSVVKRTTEP